METKFTNYHLHLFKKIIVLLVALLPLYSCSEDKGTELEVDHKIEISEEFLTPVFLESSGSKVVEFTSSGDWSLSFANTRAESWISAHPMNGGRGKNQITISVDKNDTYDERNATLHIISGTEKQVISITQKQKDALLLESSVIDLSSEGGAFSIEVNTNVSFQIEVKSDWIKEKGNSTKALSDKTLTFVAEKNETGDKREGEIILKSGDLRETIKVFQSFDKFITISQNEYLLFGNDTVIQIELKRSVDYKVKSPDVDWIKEVSTRSISTHTHFYEIESNESDENREAEIVFFNEEYNLYDTVFVCQLFKEAIVLSHSHYEIDHEGTIIELPISSNNKFTIQATVDWINHIETKSLTDYNLRFEIKENIGKSDREGFIVFRSQNSTIEQSVQIKQKGLTAYDEIERQILVEFYEKTNGKNWINKKNWCSDKPLSEWYGITVQDGRVITICLPNNNLIGSLPESFSKLSKLKRIELNNNKLSGRFFDTLIKMTDIEWVVVSHNNFTGSIPAEINQLTRLLVLAAWHNSFTGHLPDEITELKNLDTLQLGNHDENGDYPKNKLEGEIPKNIGALKKLSTLDLANNNFTGTLPISLSQMDGLYNIYLQGNRLSGNISSEIVRSMPWKLYWTPSISVIPQQEGYTLTVEHYISTDYSKDGEVKQLHKATKGNGIDIVILGDAFVDKEIEDGTYAKAMEKAMEFFFAVEPIASFKEYFNIYSVTAVSKNDGIEGSSSTAFGTKYDPATDLAPHITDHDACKRYASMVENSKHRLIMVIVNTVIGGGTCSISTDISISCSPLPIIDDRGMYRYQNLLYHEAIGHGFAMMHDEYYYNAMPMPDYMIDNFENAQKRGLYLNISTTNNPDEVPWSYFLNNPLYEKEELGVFEGAVYKEGVYKSSLESLMGPNNSNNRWWNEFNGPQRNLIFKRIMELAGEEYSIEKFAKYDTINLR
ncbi:hypothetical protein M2137_001476 [Parabacteroides sp. PFB2-10]|uniref:BACON domain-containing protein n=1 Tax=Parabacteroides sp. PFB2-10 TaxID=1742405 RepID=UPI002473894D|nr:BACON domain-containing carbohydrate-binding protein [Parabacteroides sp. PFB2-10]MDH6312701.1 hypothetical protein [Parabacteroides sp. PFB2-10]